MNSFCGQLVTVVMFLSYVNSFTGYTKYNIVQNNLCPSGMRKFLQDLTPHKYQIPVTPVHAAIVEQSWNFSNFRPTRPDCSFRVDVSQNRLSLYAVIRTLRFRKDPITDVCLDWVQFKLSDDYSSHRICGDSTIDGADFPPWVNATKGKLKVYVHIHNATSVQRSLDSLELSIVFTAYRDCSSTLSFSCDGNDKTGCISKRFVNDQIVNCPTPACLDEMKGAANVANEPSESSVGPHKIGGVTVFLISLMIGATVLWIAVKIRNCVSRCCSTDRSPSQVYETEFRTHNSSFDVPIPSAPSTLDDKDLAPPSYESLFPDR